MKRLAVVMSLVLATMMLSVLPASAHQLDQRGGVITCKTQGVNVTGPAGQNIDHVTGWLRVDNNSHSNGYQFRAQIRFWTGVQTKYFTVRNYMPAWTYDTYHFSLWIHVPYPTAQVHWHWGCFAL